ncbi:MAG: pyrroline-5-carboxylate reductase [Candidatus Paceibacterota bacterium]
MVKGIKLSIIGLGHMGLPIAQAIINSKVIAAANLTLVNRDLKCLKKLKKNNPKIQISSLVEIINSPDYLIIAVKPQDFPELALSLKSQLKKTTTVISIMAGTSVAKIKKLLGVSKVVRLMPNLPIAQQAGVIGCFYNSEIVALNKKFIKKLFASQGLFLELKQENQINQVTAIAGSGPAYVAYFMNELEAAAKKFGFSDEIAEQIVRQTFLGTISYLIDQKIKPRELIAQVKSKGGTTEAALRVFQDKQIGQSLQEAYQKAFQRCVELSS